MTSASSRGPAAALLLALSRCRHRSTPSGAALGRPAKKPCTLRNMFSVSLFRWAEPVGRTANGRAAGRPSSVHRAPTGLDSRHRRTREARAPSRLGCRGRGLENGGDFDGEAFARPRGARRRIGGARHAARGAEDARGSAPWSRCRHVRRAGLAPDAGGDVGRRRSGDAQSELPCGRPLPLRVGRRARPDQQPAALSCPPRARHSASR